MRKYLLILSILISLLPLYSQEALSDVDLTTLTAKEIYTLIDQSIDSKSDEIIYILTTIEPDFQDYNKFENYILNRAEELVEQGGLDYSLSLIEAVLYNNLENEKAQVLYTIILDKQTEIKERVEAEKILEERKREEIEEVAEIIEEEIEQEELLTDVIYENLELFSVIDTYSDKFDKAGYITSFYFYPLMGRYYSSEVYDGYADRKSTTNSFEGQAIDVSLGWNIGQLSIKSDSSIGAAYEELIYDNTFQISALSIISIGLNSWKLPLAARTGFLYETYSFDNDEEIDIAITELPSPLIGFGAVDWHLFNLLRVDLTGDLLIAPFYTDNLDFGFRFNTSLAVNLFRISKQVFELKAGYEYLYLNEGDLKEDRSIIKLGFGVTSYE